MGRKALRDRVEVTVSLDKHAAAWLYYVAISNERPLSRTLDVALLGLEACPFAFPTISAAVEGLMAADEFPAATAPPPRKRIPRLPDRTPAETTYAACLAYVEAKIANR